MYAVSAQTVEIAHFIISHRFDSANLYVNSLSDKHDQEFYKALVKVWEQGGQHNFEADQWHDKHPASEVLIGSYYAFTGKRAEALALLNESLEMLGTEDPLRRISLLAILHLYSRILLSGSNYASYLDQWQTLAVEPVHHAWYHIHKLQLKEKSLIVQDDKSGWTNLLKEADLFFKEQQLPTTLQAHFLTRKALHSRAIGADSTAIQHFKKSISYCAAYDFLKQVKFLNMLDLAGLYFKDGLLDSSKWYLDRAKVSWDNSDQVLTQLNYYSILAHNYYKPAEKWDSAYFAMEQLLGANLQSFFEANNVRITELSQQLEAEKREAEIKSQQDQIVQQRRLLWVALGFLLILVALLAALLQARANIQRKNKKISLLIRELHHRVKNNLQVISSLLGLQAMKLTDEASKNAIAESKSRIGVMSLIHQKLYQNKEIAGLDIADYVHSLVKELVQTYGFHDKIELKMDIFREPLDTDTSLSVGLIINELVCNAFKYAFVNVSQPRLEVVLRNEGNAYLLRVSDNGIGLPAHFDLETHNAFGVKLVRLLVRQVKGVIHLDGTNGTIWSITFKGFFG